MPLGIQPAALSQFAYTQTLFVLILARITILMPEKLLKVIPETLF